MNAAWSGMVTLRRTSIHHPSYNHQRLWAKRRRPHTEQKDGSHSETLGKAEFKLLKYLITYPNKSYSCTQLIDYVWGNHIYIEERTVDVNIFRLRKILQRFELEEGLETVGAIGYRWQV